MTRIMSRPIDLIHLKGMTYTNSRPKKPQGRPGPGIIIELIQPFLGSKSISITQPIIQQSSSLITACFLVQISSYNTSFYIIILNIKYVFLKGKVHITGIIMKY